MNALIQLAVIIQIILIFAPPISLGERSLFIGDVWIIIWSSAGFIGILKDRKRRERFKILGGAFVLIGLFSAVALHGALRPVFSQEFTTYVGISRDSSFNLGREIAVGLRFATWILAGWVIAQYSLKVSLLLKVLALCSAIASLVMIIAFVLPTTGEVLGSIYGYSPTAHPWPERIYGPFRSPIEACASLTLAALLLFATPWARLYLRLAIIALIFIGIILSKTITAPIAFLCAVAYISAKKLPARVAALIFSGAALVAIPILLFSLKSGFLAFKFGNLIYRLKPWALYWDMISGSWHHLLLGLGFLPLFSDNFFVFVVSRGGLVLLAFVATVGTLSYARNQRYFGPFENSIFLFLLCAALSVDILIIRPVVYIFIGVGIPVLMLNRRSAGTPSLNSV